MDTTNSSRTTTHRRTAHKLPLSVDLAAIGIALALAALVRLGAMHHHLF